MDQPPRCDGEMEPIDDGNGAFVCCPPYSSLFSGACRACGLEKKAVGPDWTGAYPGTPCQGFTNYVGKCKPPLNNIRGLCKSLR